MAQIRPSYMKVICPTAPTVPVTLNAGFRMPSWFDLKTLDMYGPEDEDGIRAATVQIQSLIQTEISAGNYRNDDNSNFPPLTSPLKFFFLIFFF